MLKYSGQPNKRIVLLIFSPLLLSLSLARNDGINFAYIVFFVQCAIFFSSLFNIKLSYKTKPMIIFSLMVLLFLICVFSSLLSEMPLDAFRLSYVVFVPSIFLMLLTLSDKSPYWTFILASKVHVSIGTCLSLLALVIFLFGKMTTFGDQTSLVLSFGPIALHQIIMGQPPFYRLASLTSNPNTLGIVLMFSQILTIYLYKSKFIARNGFVVIYLIQIITLVFTQSRGAIVASVIMVCLFHLVSNETIAKKMKVCLGTIVASVVGIYIVLLTESNTLLRLSSGLTGRAQAWTLILDNIKANPFLGVGFGLSGDLITSNIGIKAHNVYLSVFSEIGLIGFIVFCLVWILATVYSFQGVKFYKGNKAIMYTYTAIFVMLLSLMFHQLIESKLLVYDYVMFFWTYLLTLSAMRLS